jgi:DNA polymerase type B, organellar and viral
MKPHDIDQQVAVRAWTESSKPRWKGRRSAAKPQPVQHVLVFDTETTVDETQTLLYGCFRYCRVDGTTVTTVAEGLIYADDLPETDPAGYATLQAYAASHKADVDLTYLGVEPNWELALLSRTEFVNRWLWHVGYPHNNRHDPATIVAFNAPFDLSRIAVDVAEARRDLYGGFSLTLWADPDGTPARWRPRLAIKSLDSKRALKKFRRLERGANNFTGHLLDLRTLVFALTGASHSLDSACTAFDVEGKAASPELGVITDEAIDYCREDVAATTRLYEAVMAEYATHPINLEPTAAYSPASLAKAYLRKMDIQPRLTAQPDFPAEILGYAMSAFYGGRAEVHLRHTPAPVAVVDFTSMYPTVDILMGIWDLVIATSIETVDMTSEINQLLGTVTPEDCFNPELWRRLVVIVEIIPEDGIVPVRSDYQPDSWSIGLNPLHASEPLWYTLPDLIASTILTGHPARIRRAFRFIPSAGPQARLTPVALGGELVVDPRQQDFFQRVVEARQELRQSVPDHPHDSCLCSTCRLIRFLKVLANSGSYGIYAEMNRREHPDTVIVHGPSGTPFTTKVAAPENPGEYCFPPIAACITGAARLMLALLEHAVEAAGGTWMFCDTDSIAIIASADGADLIACPGGIYRLPDGTPAIAALSYQEVDEIRARFDTLNPYNRAAVRELLKLEHTGICYAISAKRYVVYSQDEAGRH